MTKIITPEAFLSYPHLIKPQPNQNGGEPKYSVALVFKADADLSALRAAIEQAAIDKFGTKAKAMLASEQLDCSLRRNAKKDDYEAKAPGGFFLNARSVSRPGLVFPWAGEDGKPARVSEEQIGEVFYPGAIVRASIAVFAYDKAGKKGVSFSLNNLQKLRDADRWAGRANAEDEFAALGSASDYAGSL